jgi:hypothetical protein
VLRVTLLRLLRAVGGKFAAVWRDGIYPVLVAACRFGCYYIAIECRSFNASVLS